MRQQIGAMFAGLIGVLLLVPGTALAQTTPPASEVAVEAAAATPSAEASAVKTPEEAPTTIGSADAGQEVGDKEELSFRQAKAAAEMAELEQRMFRLAEAIKQLEPENSSRLRLGLKYAREELILHQMKETQALLDQLDLTKARGEAEQLLDKLERLHDLLLATDLNFQLQLERLRTMREALRRLTAAIKEEEREQGQSAEAAEKAKKAEGLRKKKVTLDELIKQQTGHVEQASKLAESELLDSAGKESLGKLGEAQRGTQKGAKELAGAENPSSENLSQAEQQMGAGSESAEQGAAEQARDAMQQALASLEKEREKNSKELEQTEAELTAARFNAMKKDQYGNRQLTEGITEMVRGLGQGAAGAVGELIRAGGSMSGAEGSLGQSEPEPADSQQQDAVKSLKYAKEQLETEAERLLAELAPQVRKKVIEAITLMLEKQVAVRESNVTLAPQARDGSRAALSALTDLAPAEGKIVDVGEETIALVEETEFGIALPAALRVVVDAMQSVEESLAAGDASEAVIDREKQIEEDLSQLLDAMKKMPPQRPPQGPPKKSGNPRDRERELNRIIAELKMIRILQVRVHGDTVGADTERAANAERLSLQLREKIEDLAGRQDDLKSVTERLNAERGQELEQ